MIHVEGFIFPAFLLGIGETIYLADKQTGVIKRAVVIATGIIIIWLATFLPVFPELLDNRTGIATIFFIFVFAAVASLMTAVTQENKKKQMEERCAGCTESDKWDSSICYRHICQEKK